MPNDHLKLTDDEVAQFLVGAGNPISDAWRVYRFTQSGAERAKTRQERIRLECEGVIEMLRAAGIGVRIMAEDEPDPPGVTKRINLKNGGLL